MQYLVLLTSTTRARTASSVALLGSRIWKRGTSKSDSTLTNQWDKLQLPGPRRKAEGCEGKRQPPAGSGSDSDSDSDTGTLLSPCSAPRLSKKNPGCPVQFTSDRQRILSRCQHVACNILQFSSTADTPLRLAVVGTLHNYSSELKADGPPEGCLMTLLHV